MKNRWILFTCFCLLFVLLFVWMNAAVGQAEDRWVGFYKLPRNSIDVVFLGNSHSINSFQPQVVNGILGVSSYSTGILGENVLISYYELREILKYQKPKVVVLETYTLDLTEPIQPALIFGFTDAGVWDLNKAELTAKVLPFDIAYTTLPLFHNVFDWNDPGKFLSKLSDSLRIKKYYKDQDFGSTIVPYFITEEEYQAAVKLPEVASKDSSDTNQYYLDKIAELCKKNGVHLLLVKAPIIKVYGEGYTSFDVPSYAKEKHIDLVTFGATNFNELHFYNNDHVNSFGSIILSVETALEISNKYGLSVDQEKLDYYRSFYFSNFTLAHKKNVYTIKLVPENPGAPLEYQFSIYKRINNEKILSSDWQSDNEYHFTLPDDDDYCVNVYIKNMNGDYEMTGILQLFNRKTDDGQ